MTDSVPKAAAGRAIPEHAPTPAPSSPVATLDAWRALGHDRFDPVRFHFLEALARRAATRDGAARQSLDARLAARIAAYGGDLERAQGTARATAAPPIPPGPGALAALVDLLAQAGGSATAAEPGGTAPAELKALSHFRHTWSRLSADRRLTQSLANVPGNAGPLNSQQLVHRALSQMRELSPAYLHRFMAHVDTLQWLEQASGAAVSAPGKESVRHDAPRKAARGKPG